MLLIRNVKRSDFIDEVTAGLHPLSAISFIPGDVPVEGQNEGRLCRFFNGIQRVKHIALTCSFFALLVCTIHAGDVWNGIRHISIPS